MWAGLQQNLKYSIRSLLKSRGFTLTAVLTIALGIGATTAIFSVVYAVFEPMPYPNPDQLVMVWTKPRGGTRTSVSAGDFRDWQERNTSFQSMNAWTGVSFNVATNERPELVAGSRRTPGFFTMEGLPMMLGRDFVPEEGQPGRDRVVVLSNRMWSNHFGADRNIVGKQIRMNSEPYTVVGVLQPGNYDRFNSQFWIPLTFNPEQGRNAQSMLVMARLKDGVSLERAQSEMEGIARQLQSENPKSNANLGVSVESLHLDFVTDKTRRNLWLLLGAVGFLLLIACVNVANLLFARGTSRQREVALRAALGASRTRLFGQFLTESLVLAFIGGTLGLLFARIIINAIEAVMPPVGTMLPSEAHIRLSLPVLVFTMAVTAIAGLLFGSAPAWQATRLDLNEVLKLGNRTGSGGGRRNVRRALVVAEFSLALTLLASSGLALKGFWNLTRVDLGIRAEGVLSFQLPVPEKRLNSPEQIRTYYQQILEKIEAVPGVKTVAAMTGVPARGPNSRRRITIAGRPILDPSERPRVAYQSVTAGYVETLDIRITKGRGINEQDTANSTRVAVVNEEFVRRFFSDQDPLSQRISIDEPGPNGKSVEWQVVGVFHNVRGVGSRDDNFPQIDVPFWQSPTSQTSMVIRTEGDPKTFIKSITGAVNSVDPELPLAGMKTVDEIVAESLAIDRFSVVLFSSFGTLGLLLAAVGIYGVMSFGVAQRTQEFGVRMALGAQRVGVIQLVLKEGVLLAMVGALIGLGGAYLVGRAMQSTLYGVGAMDLKAFGIVALVLLLAAVLACLFPAWRASRVEPIEALRHE